MGSVLILFAHPALRHSRVNRALIDGISEIEGVTLHDLYELYPEFGIDVAAEQQLAELHDVIIFQHPLYWYSVPAILKEWQDLVLEHGWAYGTGGSALSGKRFLCAVTTGGGGEAYRTDGYNRHTIRQLLAPVEQTARLCNMICLPPYVVHGTHLMTPEGAEAARRDYHRVLADLRDGLVESSSDREYLNEPSDSRSVTRR